MALSVGIGTSSEKDPAVAVRDALNEARLHFGHGKIDLALLFATTDLSYYSALLKSAGLLLGNTPLVGCSSAAVFSHKNIIKQGVAIMLLGFPEGVHFNTACSREIESRSQLNVGFDLGERLLHNFHNVPRDLGLSFFVGSIDHATALIHGMQERFGSSFPLVGAFATDSPYFPKTFLYFNQETLTDAASAVILGGKIRFGWGIRHGWQPLGKPQTITKSKGNIVYNIGGEIAAKFYEDYFGFDTERLRQELKRISVFYPIGIYLKNEEEFLLRNIVSIQDDGSLVFQGDVPENSQIRLMIGTKESCLNAAAQAIEDAKSRIGNHNISCAIAFDSLSRLMLLGRGANRELETIKKALPANTPLIGVYTQEELAPLMAMNYLGKTYIHNQAIALLVLGTDESEAV